MKNLTYSILLLFSFGALTAQSEADCPANLSIFAEFAKVKNYDSAYLPWLEVKTHCPELNEATYIYGERILDHKIKIEEDNSEYISMLSTLYDNWLSYFPTDRRGRSQRGKIMSAKAQSMMQYETAPMAEIYATFDTAFNSDMESFSNPKALESYFKSCYSMFKDGDENITMDALFSKYEDISEKLLIENEKLSRRFDQLIKKEENGESLTSREKRTKRISEVNTLAISQIINNLNVMISSEASCDNLVTLYRTNFDSNRFDEKWLSRALRQMNVKECSGDPLFVELVEALHAVSPSAISAKYLGISSEKSGKNKEAISFFQESLSLEMDDYKKADINYRISSNFMKRGLKSQARKYANQALVHKPSMGKAYILIAGLYAESANDCGEDDEFEKRAVYWLSAKTARKAAIVDPSLKEKSRRLEASYNGLAPSKTDIFTQGKAGEVISFDCWIRSSVTVPNL